MGNCLKSTSDEPDELQEDVWVVKMGNLYPDLSEFQDTCVVKMDIKMGNLYPDLGMYYDEDLRANYWRYLFLAEMQ